MLNFLIIFIILFVLEVLYLKIAIAKGIIDNPNHRSAHITPTIRGGGIIYVPALLLFLFFYSDNSLNYLPLIISVFIVAIISFIDDINPLSTKIRITMHCIAFTIIFYQFGFFNAFSILSGVFLILTYAFSLGYLNIYNFMDGINGITFLNALATFGGLWGINKYVVEFENSNLLMVYILATLVFGFFNFRLKPKCFLGDVGSIAIGFSIIYFVIKLFVVTQNYVTFLLLGVYLLDGGWTIVERILRKENVFKAHRRHLYQQFANELKIPHLKISTGYFVVQLLCNGFVYYMLLNNNDLILIALSLFVVLSFVYLYLKKRTYDKVEKLNAKNN